LYNYGANQPLGPSLHEGPIITPWSPIARWGGRYAYDVQT
jgi:hypothetical protein